MRTIAIEEHFLADGFREAMNKQGGSSTRAIFARIEEKLSDLGAGRLKDMDADRIDLQLLSHTLAHIESLPVSETVTLARQANDQLAAAVAAPPDRFAGFATLPMTDPKAAADEL